MGNPLAGKGLNTIILWCSIFHLEIFIKLSLDRQIIFESSHNSETNFCMGAAVFLTQDLFLTFCMQSSCLAMGEVYIIAKKISDFLEGIKPVTWKYQLDIVFLPPQKLTLKNRTPFKLALLNWTFLYKYWPLLLLLLLLLLYNHWATVQELQLSWVMFTYKVFLCTSSVLVVNCGLNNVIFYLM